MKILMIAACPFPANRGTPSRILKMSEALARKGCDVTVLTYHNRDYELANKDLTVFRILKIPFYKDNSPGPNIFKPLADLMLFFAGLYLCKKNKFDLIHAHHIEGGLCASLICKILNVKYVFDSHVIVESEIKSYEGYNFPFFLGIVKKIEEICYQQSSGIVYVAKEIMNYVHEEYELEDKIQLVLPTGTNISEILLLVKNAENPFLNAKGRNIVYTGSVSKYQNLEDFVALSRKCLDLDLNFYIVTGQKEKDGIDLLKKVAEYNLNRFHVLFERKFEEQINYANHADILISTRHFLGGIPQKITNYAALRRKIVASNDSVKIFDHDSAYIYESGNIPKFKEKVIEALENIDNSKEKKAFEIVKKFDWDNLTKELIEFYSKVIYTTAEEVRITVTAAVPKGSA